MIEVAVVVLLTSSAEFYTVLIFQAPFILRLSISVLVAPNRIVNLVSAFSLLLERNLAVLEASFFKSIICFAMLPCRGFCEADDNKPPVLTEVLRESAKTHESCGTG